MRYLSVMFILLLSACSTKAVIDPKNYDPTQHARLRIFSFNGSGAGFYVGIDCENNKSGTHILPMGLDSLWGSKESKQTRIGMIQTKPMDKAQVENGVFGEYVIPAGKPVNIFPSLTEWENVCVTPGKPCTVRSKNLCKLPSDGNLFTKVMTLGLYDGKTVGDVRSFVPQAGKQYEYVPTGCNISISDITEEEIQAVTLSFMYRCEKK